MEKSWKRYLKVSPILIVRNDILEVILWAVAAIASTCFHQYLQLVWQNRLSEFNNFFLFCSGSKVSTDEVCILQSDIFQNVITGRLVYQSFEWLSCGLTLLRRGARMLPAQLPSGCCLGYARSSRMVTLNRKLLTLWMAPSSSVRKDCDVPGVFSVKEL